MAIAAKEITIAHSPDSDDAFMFYGLAAGKVETYGITVNQLMNDIQSLNIEARQARYEVSAISFAAYPELAERYMLMPCGASMGLNYGPLIVAREQLPVSELSRLKLAIPGKQTSAYLAARLLEKNLDVVECPFDKILEEVAAGAVDAGLIIHEGQLTYKQMGLKKIIDLGQWWYQETGGLPLPLGGNVVRKDLTTDLIGKLTRMLQDSISYSLEHRDEALSYALKFARGLQNKDEADKFVGMYVNELTVDFGELGKKALIKFFEMAYEKGIIENKLELEFAQVFEK